MADSPKVMVQQAFCKSCDNYKRHQVECMWCEYETGMVHPSRFQPVLEPIEKTPTRTLMEENFRLKQENAELKRGITKLYQSLGGDN